MQGAPASAFYPAALIVRTPLFVNTHPLYGHDRGHWRAPQTVWAEAAVVYPSSLIHCEYQEYDAEMRTTLRVIGEKPV